MLDLLSIGDVTIDHFFFVSSATIHRVRHPQRFLCFPYGTKVGVDAYVHTTAGNAANVAVGAARLELKTGLATIMGDDSGGREILHKMKKEGVMTTSIIAHRNEHTNISAVMSVGGERTILVYHARRAYERLTLPRARGFYLTSAGPRGPGLTALHRKVLRVVSTHPSTLFGFNPGTYQLQLGLRALRPILNALSILFLNKEETEELLGLRPQRIESLLKQARQFEVPTVVITDGERGAWAVERDVIIHQPIFRTAVVERTGAGDSFACGIMAALLKGKELSEALRWGAANAASVVNSIGPQAGLLDARALHQRLTKYRRIPTQLNGSIRR